MHLEDELSEAVGVFVVEQPGRSRSQRLPVQTAAGRAGRAPRWSAAESAAAPGSHTAATAHTLISTACSFMSIANK